MAYTVKVVNNEGRGLEGLRVTLTFIEPTRGQPPEQYTDPEGCAEFDGYDEGEVKVLIDADDYGMFEYEDGATVVITVNEEMGGPRQTPKRRMNHPTEGTEPGKTMEPGKTTEPGKTP
jgi:hypothetical protein